MVKKSSKSSSKGKSAKGGWTPATTSEEVLFERFKHDQHFVVQVTPVTWPFLGFTQRVLATTVVFDIKSRIIQQHGGSITDVTLYKVRSTV